MRSVTSFLAHHAAPALHTLFVLVKQGVVRPMRPDRLVRIVLAYRRWGITLPLGFAVGAARHPDRPAVIDERGALSYAELASRTTRLAAALRDRVPGKTRIGVLTRNHHGPVEVIVAAAKIGVDVVLLNVGLSTRQLADVLAEQDVSLLVLDEEFAGHLQDLPGDLDVVLGWADGPTEHDTLDHLIAIAPDTRLPRPPRHSRLIVLTSGTTGTPKGARRPDPPSLNPAGAVFSRIPLRAGERVLLSAPLFHTWGIAGFQLSAVLGATMVLRRKFDPVDTLRTVQRHRVGAVIGVPVMLQRILDLPAEERERFDTSSLRIVAASGSALPGDLATRFQRAFGPVLYNLYGSTEVSWVSIATPADLRAAPSSAGRPPRGTQVRILDDNGEPVRRGETGRIFAGNDMLFDGYTNGKSRESRSGLMSTGDLGRFDHSGRLFIAGREDDMIISGGENVYPKEAEDAIAGLDGVVETAVLGVEDPDFGQRLAAFVVPREKGSMDADEVRDQVRSRVSKFAVPRDVIFLDELPRNATGKVVPAELRGHLDG
ncbi:acyl-CoA synthetase [Saccharopolyspora rhizosphaerae]|uniref:Acyl-CoA synthetase n=1 Tax=Saccharopolyspora rhizosphaerae TaxID=2492662 RepID=A0A3R8QU13_9PSEU|nr:acyl-CoA synthetase [Saccharopolyspora rhizosphaerae]